MDGDSSIPFVVAFYGGGLFSSGHLLADVQHHYTIVPNEYLLTILSSFLISLLISIWWRLTRFTDSSLPL